MSENSISVRVAKTDIVTYKVFLVGKPSKWWWLGYGSHDLVIPCTKRDYVRGVIAGENIKILVPEHCGMRFKPRKTYNFGVKTEATEKKIPEDIITEGIHSYVSLEDAIKYKDKFDNACIAHCIIPKGSLFYVGTFDDGAYGAVSNELKVYCVI